MQEIKQQAPFINDFVREDSRFADSKMITLVLYYLHISKVREFVMTYQEREPIEATVAELKPRMKNITITFKVMEVGEEREVSSRSDGATHRVADVTVGDSTGTVQVPMWDEAIDNINTGSTYTLKNGYTGLFRGNLRLNVGKYGELAEAETAIEEVNAENDMSAEEHPDDRPRRSYAGRGGGYVVVVAAMAAVAVATAAEIVEVAVATEMVETVDADTRNSDPN